MNSENLNPNGINYYEFKAISNSLMSEYEKDFANFVEIWVNDAKTLSVDTEATFFGGVVDTLLTKPEEFNDTYSYFKGKSPTGLQSKFIKHYIKSCLMNVTFNEQEHCEYAYARLQEDNGDTKLRDSLEKYKEHIKTFKPFIDATFIAIKKHLKLIDEKTYNHAVNLVSSAQTDPFVKNYVNLSSSNEVKVIHQLEIYETYICSNGIKLTVKGCLDKVIINHKNKKIFPFDYKTTSNSLEFEGSIFHYNYFRQGSFYSFLLALWAQKNGYEDYAIGPFSFIVLDKIKIGNNFIFILSDNDSKVGKNGGISRTGFKIKGWMEILEEIGYLTKINKWNYPYKFIVNKGVIISNVFPDQDNNIENGTIS